MMEFLALEFAGTVRHDGHGGVADDLTTSQQLTEWIRDHAEELAVRGYIADAGALAEVRALRAAVRALLARAVRPGPASPADAHRLLPDDQALDRLNRAATAHPVALHLDWAAGEDPGLQLLGPDPGELTRILAALARATAEFLAGPYRVQLRACTAPRCVRYFVKAHGRQEYCKPSCSNRARVARHYERNRPGATGVTAHWDDGRAATDLPRS
ncbi:CGNR zinc finger domain-containing protein [Kitasatospora paranensis]|uniref:CGNR zinc finger domain-containing protein n=1 Tax=Kitasatospora paranensis TaxID=258053 RepID=A0ABW2FT41_9ACTN